MALDFSSHCALVDGHVTCGSQGSSLISSHETAKGSITFGGLIFNARALD
jgi:hypothetical protein